MTLRAADKKDEHGWQIIDEQGVIVGHAASRDKARVAAKTPEDLAVEWTPTSNGGPLISVSEPDEDGMSEVEILPADNSPEAIAAQAAFDIHTRIKGLAHVIRHAWVDLAGELYMFYEGKMWEALGYESWRSYLADPDIGIEEHWAYEHLAIYKQLVIERNVDPEHLKRLRPSKVMKVLPAIRRDQVSLDEALADVEALYRSDLEDKYSGRFQPQKSRRGRPDTSSTIHTNSEPAWAQCAVCGSRYRVDPETGERVDL